jgi:hypothetical protein
MRALHHVSIFGSHNPNSFHVIAGAVAAIQANRKFVGCEMDERCHELAEARMLRWVNYNITHGTELGHFTCTAADAVRHADIAMLPLGDNNFPEGSPTLMEQLATWQLSIKSSELELLEEQDDGYSLVCVFFFSCSNLLSLTCSPD